MNDYNDNEQPANDVIADTRSVETWKTFWQEAFRLHETMLARRMANEQAAATTQPKDVSELENKVTVTPANELDTEPITSFRDQYSFLSNFHPCAIEVDGIAYPTAKHAFQALKTLDPDEREYVRTASAPAGAKQRGKKVTLRDGWTTLRFDVMEQVLRAKFADPNLRNLLLATGERELIEGNTWRDTTWGCVQSKDGMWKGQNRLGQMLTGLRSEWSDKEILKL